MRKNSKNKTAAASSVEDTTKSASEALTPAKRSARTTRSPAKKKSASEAKAKQATRTSRVKSEKAGAEPSDADIRLRAYFIAERRVQLALQGDPAKDWLEAKQQLDEEARQAR